METGFEMERIKEKKKLLQLKISEMKAEISKKECVVKKLEDDLEKVRLEIQSEPEMPADAGENKMNLFMKDVCIVIGAIVTEEAYMKAKYVTQTSQVYYKIEKEVFEDYITRLSVLPVKEFIEYCKKLSFLKMENNKCVFPNGRTRVYFLSKAIVDGIRA